MSELYYNRTGGEKTMTGIDMNQPITYLYSSLRYFNANEHHVKRFSNEDILLLVFDGVLRFSESGHQHEVHAGEYYIQQKNMYHDGEIASDSPKYLYVHFLGEWIDNDASLAHHGYFDYVSIKSLMEELDQLCHNKASYIEQAATFYEILSCLYQTKKESTIADQIAEYISKNCITGLTLDMICNEFNYSKNHMINIFKKEYGLTPFEYMNYIKIKQAEYLLEITSRPAESIAYECGFHNYSHFYRLFYRIHNASPSEWRKWKRISPVR